MPRWTNDTLLSYVKGQVNRHFLLRDLVPALKALRLRSIGNKAVLISRLEAALTAEVAAPTFRASCATVLSFCHQALPDEPIATDAAAAAVSVAAAPAAPALSAAALSSATASAVAAATAAAPSRHATVSAAASSAASAGSVLGKRPPASRPSYSASDSVREGGFLLDKETISTAQRRELTSAVFGASSRFDPLAPAFHPLAAGGGGAGDARGLVRAPLPPYRPAAAMQQQQQQPARDRVLDSLKSSAAYGGSMGATSSVLFASSYYPGSLNTLSGQAPPIIFHPPPPAGPGRPASDAASIRLACLCGVKKCAADNDMFFLICATPGCRTAYHTACVGLSEAMPDGARWRCPLCRAAAMMPGAEVQAVMGAPAVLRASQGGLARVSWTPFGGSKPAALMGSKFAAPSAAAAAAAAAPASPGGKRSLRLLCMAMNKGEATPACIWPGPAASCNLTVNGTRLAVPERAADAASAHLLDITLMAADANSVMLAVPPAPASSTVYVMLVVAVGVVDQAAIMRGILQTRAVPPDVAELALAASFELAKRSCGAGWRGLHSADISSVAAVLVDGGRGLATADALEAAAAARRGGSSSGSSRSMGGGDDDDDDELGLASLPLAIRDVNTRCPINIPVRGDVCRHTVSGEEAEGEDDRCCIRLSPESSL